MLVSRSIEDIINKNLRKETQDRTRKHKPSGKLSASMLGYPLQWQVLKYLGVPRKEDDDYTLKKFERGRNVEDWLIAQLKKQGLVIDEQKDCEFMDTVGKLDILVKGKIFKLDNSLPVEVKSTANSAYKWITKRKEPNYSHYLQAGLYGLALQKPYFSICYVATDDYRTYHFIYNTNKVRAEVENIINIFQKTIINKEIPMFEPLEKWHEMEKYNPYPEWINMTEDQLKTKAEKLYKE